MPRKQPPKSSKSVPPVVDVSKGGILPKVVRDARFRAGRTLVQKGQASRAIDVFATLLEEARTKFGEDHFETCPAYYEYGNALFRYSNRRRLDQLDSVAAVAANGDNDDQQSSSDDKKPPPITKSQDSNDFKNRMREAAASAAMRRAANQSSIIDKPDSIKSKDENITKSNDEIQQTKSQADDNIPKTEETTSAITSTTNTPIIDPDIMSDIQLSLEIMETAWAILDECQQKNNNDNVAITYSDWIQEQVPRVLTGIGDVLSSLERHADAADAYSRALGYREEMLTLKFTTDKEKESVEYLKCRRLIVESNVLIAEELLACPYDEDVITTETQSVLVRASEGVVDFARGYYDKARDELQETVLLMGQLSAAGIDIGEEKEDVCFVATMVMGVGTTLAEIDEGQNNNDDDSTPVAKKVKTEK